MALRQQHPLLINHKKVYRLCKEMKLLRPQRKLRKKFPRRLANNREITAPNQLWEMDIKYEYLSEERNYFFVASILDVYDRSVIAQHIGKTCEAKQIVLTLEQALWRKKIPYASEKPVLRTDNCP
jgi:putative transposase